MSTEKTIWYHQGERVLVHHDGVLTHGKVHQQGSMDYVSIMLLGTQTYRFNTNQALPMDRATVGDLHTFDFGVHVGLLEEWNEEAGFMWGEASIRVTDDLLMVMQTDGLGCLVVATYIASGEGDLLSLRVYGQEANGPQGREYLNRQQEN